MGTAMLTYVEVDGVDVSSYVKSWNIDKPAFKEITDINIVFIKTVRNITDVDNGGLLTIYRGQTASTDYAVFKGYIQSVNIEGARLNIYAKDMLVLMERTNINKTYEQAIDTQAGVGSEIFKDLITRAGLSYSSASIIDTGTVDKNLISKFICRQSDIFAKCQELADRYGYQFYYKPSTDLVYFEPKGYSNASQSLVVGENVVNVPKWEENNVECENVITMYGAQQEVEYTQNFIGDGATTDFLVNKVPQSIKVYVNDVLKIGGVTGSTSGDFDYSVDKEKKVISFKTAPISGADVEIRFSYYIPIPVKRSNAESREEYGVHERSIFKEDLENIDDAENFVKGRVDERKDPYINSVLNVVSTDDFSILNLEAGQTVPVIDSINNKNQQLMITKIKMSWPYKYDEVEVGDKLWRLGEWQANTSDRVKKLEEKAAKNQDLLVQVFDTIRNLRVQRRYMKLDIARNGAVSAVESVSQGNRKYKEFFYDDEFADSGTASWTSAGFSF